ncbi:MAG: carboxylating nicotinate-nucleotide diphosphorylase [Candidatus Omnitrophota bacterium]|nr:carboxylating nicotinate-nucleotide diphosphorylase [Candidatus Omnitrophota bacterium]
MGRESQATSITREALLPLLTAALKEDVGSRDITSSALIPKGQLAKAEIMIRREGVIAGLQVAEWVFSLTDARIKFQPTVKDGQKVYPDKAVAFLEGPSRGILAGERVALNFLGHLSGIATLTRAFVDKVKGTSAKILETRKTLPGLRLLEKYAVRVGGGVNHRMGLYDGILIKDNHLRLAGGVEKAVALARSASQKETPIEVEVSSLQEFRQALAAKADLILLDNMKLPEMQEAVRLRNAVARSKGGVKPLLEVSGGVTLESVRPIALTGVDRISVGALTHSAPTLNIALEVVR